MNRRTRGILKWSALGASFLAVIVIALLFAVWSATGATGVPVSSVVELPPEPPVSPRALPAEPLPEGVRSLDDLLEPIRREHERPALAAAVVRSSGLVAIGAVGLRNAAGEERVTAGDRFHLGSCTKAMTATLLADLVEEGKLSWETTLVEAFPELAEAMHPAFRDVTLEQLLYHRSGLPEDRRPDETFRRVAALEGEMPARRRAVAEIVLTREPAAEPGTKMLYSNLGYTLAGAIAEQAAGESWEELMRARLFEPLGMTSAGFGPPGVGEGVAEPWGHRRFLGRYQPVAPGPGADNPAVIGPAGTVHASLADWAKFAALHLRGARGDAERLRPETFRKLHADPYEQDYAMGWVVAERDWAGGRVLHHAGSNTMWMAVVWLAPERDLAFLAATNSGDAGSYPALDAAIARLVETFR